MAIISAPHELAESDLFFDLSSILGRSLYLKCEGLNLGGSIKMRAAAAMVAAADRAGQIDEDSWLIESSSGNVGVALSIIAANRGLTFTCVTDRRCNEITAALMRALGAELVVIQKPDADRGFLGARLDYVRQRCSEDARYVWLNQYANDANWGAHYDSTAPVILKHFPDLDVLFVGVGTGGTAMGCVGTSGTTEVPLEWSLLTPWAQPHSAERLGRGTFLVSEPVSCPRCWSLPRSTTS